MFAKRLPLLSAFAGGCLSSAALIGFWRADAAKRPAATEPTVRQRTAEAFVSPPAPTSPVREGAVPDDSSAERTAEPQAEPAAQPRPEAAVSPTLPSSSVADVLSHLEASYRQALAVAAVRDTPAKTGRELSSTGSGAGPRIADREPPAPHPTTAVTETPPPLAIAHEEVALARADTATPAKKTQQADAQVAPMADAAPVLISRDDVRPRYDYAGDTHPNIYVGNIYQGDVYQVQQLAVLQYIQLLAPLAYTGLASPAQLPGGVTTRRASPFSTSLTNPDNPWGFSFHPPVLVK